LTEIKNILSEQEIHPELIEKIIESNIEAFSPAILNDPLRLKKFVKHQLTAFLPPMRNSAGLLPANIMVVVGSSGCGKTSTCAKLASFYTVTMGKKVVWIEADTIRTSAISESRTYTETLGIPLFLAYTPKELVELLESQSDAELILVDTTSYNPERKIA
jgi:flagellar biosynthesis protein FlhF